MRTRECLADGNKTEEIVCETRLGGNYKDEKGCEVGTPCHSKYINILSIEMWRFKKYVAQNVAKMSNFDPFFKMTHLVIIYPEPPPPLSHQKSDKL